MDINFSCKHCGQSIVIDEAGVGMEIPCPSCQTPLVVPPLPTPPPLVLTQICPQCERGWPAEALTCGHCGTQLHEEEKPPPVATSAPGPRVPAAPRIRNPAPAAAVAPPVSAPLPTETPAQPPPPPAPEPAHAEVVAAAPSAEEDEYECTNPHCGRTWSESQLEHQQVGRKNFPVCPSCRLAVRKLAKPMNFWSSVPGAFVYPFRGAGGWILGFGCLLAAFLDVGGALGGFLVLLIALIFFFGFFGMMLINVIRSTADDPAETLDWPELTGFGDVFAVAMRWLGATLLVFSPFLVCWYIAREDLGYGLFPNLILMLVGRDAIWHSAWAVPLSFLSFLGCVYYPMALLGVAMFDSVKGVNPVLVVPSIFKVPLQYASILVLIAAMIGLREGMVVGLLGALPFVAKAVGFVLIELFALYSMIVSARLLGLLYRANAEEIGWFN